MVETVKGTDAEVGQAALHGKKKPYGSAFSSSVTIGKPRDELYAFWSDFANLPRFMENVISVASLGQNRSRWKIRGPSGPVEFESDLIEDVPGSTLGWKSVEGADVENVGRVEFSDAPGDRGTEVRVSISFKAPMGAVGRIVAATQQRDPHIQARRDLRRFKQLMETGEVATAIGANVKPPKS